MKHKIAADPLPLDFTSGKAFYVYLYRDPRPRKKQAAIYVGKGMVKHARAEAQLRRNPTNNPFLAHILSKITAAGLQPIIEIIGAFDNEEDAFKCEIALIKQLGRRDRKLGSLCNLTDGGEGGRGYVPSQQIRQAFIERMRDIPKTWLNGRPVSPETRAKMSSSAKARGCNDKQMDNLLKGHGYNRGKPMSPEQRALLSALRRSRPPTERELAHLKQMQESLKGRPLPLEQRLKISAALKGRPLNPNQIAAIERRRGVPVPQELILKILQAKLSLLQSRVSFDDVKTDFLNGDSCNKIADRYKLAHATVYGILVYLGLALPKKALDIKWLKLKEADATA